VSGIVLRVATGDTIDGDSGDDDDDDDDDSVAATVTIAVVGTGDNAPAIASGTLGFVAAAITSAHGTFWYRSTHCIASSDSQFFQLKISLTISSDVADAVARHDCKRSLLPTML
jgi:hypothetical protein